MESLIGMATVTKELTNSDKNWDIGKRAAYSGEELFHAIQWAVEGSQDFGLLDGAVWSVSQLSVALEHRCWVTPAHLLQVVETSRTPVTISPGGQSLICGLRWQNLDINLKRYS